MLRYYVNIEIDKPRGGEFLDLDTKKLVKSGDVIKVETDRAGTPLSRFWRSRVQDFNKKLDNAIKSVTKVSDNQKVNKK